MGKKLAGDVPKTQLQESRHFYNFCHFSEFWICSFLGLVFIDLADPGAPGASGPILGDPARFRAFRTHLGRPRHQGKQKNDLRKKKIDF